MTAFASGLDDATTRFDRNEPQLNVSTGPDDERDTTTPAAIVESMRAVPLAGGLQPAGRERRTTSLVANTTGDATIRAGMPAGWLIGDRTGTEAQGERNDVGIVLPPDRAPLVSPSTPTRPTRPTRSLRPATPPSARRQRSRYGGSSVNSRHTTLGKERSWDT
ncbi:serine hydrolase [Streptomyces rubrogriseus]|uniref:serine hydrolase n=1 Tax=Streptomyces rubrogriseus TaxID=194673 RepID=UPI001FD09701